MLKYILLLLLIQPILQSYILRQNNVCRTFDDYYNPDNSDKCYYDPDTTLTTPELIEKYAGVFENHEVVTEDGYILTLFRIPRKDPKGIILIHHSIATYSHIYLWQGNDSLALTLWHNGFDVWLANHRGTSYSDKHIAMSSWEYRYWDFSFHELGLYDVSAEVKYIKEKSNQGMKIIYMGHSLGSAAGLVYASLKAEEAKEHLKSMILLAAPCYLEHVNSSVFTLFTDSGPALKAFMDSLQMGSPLMLLPLILQVSRLFLRLFPIFLFVTSWLVWAFCGYTPEETDPTFFNYDGTIYLNNFSWKIILHYLQIYHANHRFQFYDYGKEKNLEVYKEEMPPVYPLDKLSVPTLLVSSYNDTLITLEDSEILYSEIPENARIDHWKVLGLNHLDYHVGLHRKEAFVNRLLPFLKEMTS